MDWNSLTGTLAVALITAALVVWLVRRQYKALLRAQEKASEVALREAQLGLREKESANETAFRSKVVEQDLKARELARLESQLESEREQLNRKAQEIEKGHDHLESTDKEVEKARQLYREKLHAVSKMDSEAAREVLINEMRKECEAELRSLRQEYLSDSGVP